MTNEARMNSSLVILFPEKTRPALTCSFFLRGQKRKNQITPKAEKASPKKMPGSHASLMVAQNSSALANSIVNKVKKNPVNVFVHGIFWLKLSKC